MSTPLIASSRPIAPSYRISEFFLSIQGEGPRAGTPAYFLRLQGCDVGCHWCDTRYSWDPEGGEPFVLERLDNEAPWARLLFSLSERDQGEARLLVVTGGEPLQHPGIAALLESAVGEWPEVEVETSGIAPPPLSHPELFYNVSPKLPSVTERWKETWAHAAAWIEEPGATFKIVVGSEADAIAAFSLIGEHGIPAERVMLMPEGKTEEELRANAPLVAHLCKRHGYRLSPRLHIWMWGPKRGV